MREALGGCTSPSYHVHSSRQQERERGKEKCRCPLGSASRIRLDISSQSCHSWLSRTLAGGVFSLAVPCLTISFNYPGVKLISDQHLVSRKRVPRRTSHFSDSHSPSPATIGLSR